jgi:hypothetical protein
MSAGASGTGYSLFISKGAETQYVYFMLLCDSLFGLFEILV